VVLVHVKQWTMPEPVFGLRSGSEFRRLANAQSARHSSGQSRSSGDNLNRIRAMAEVSALPLLREDVFKRAGESVHNFVDLSTPETIDQLRSQDRARSSRLDTS